jgi:hypothetical protein
MSCGPDTDVVPLGLAANLKKVVTVTRRSLRRDSKSHEWASGRGCARFPRGAHHQVAPDTGKVALPAVACRRDFAAHSSQVSNRVPRRA